MVLPTRWTRSMRALVRVSAMALGWGFEGLGLVAGPDGADGLAVDALVDAVGYGFDFGEFGHAFAVYGQRLNTDLHR